MAQVKLIKCEKKENGIKIYFEDLDGNEFSGIYTRTNLTLEQLNKMVGQHISFSEKGTEFHAHKAWDKKNDSVVYCDDSFHTFD